MDESASRCAGASATDERPSAGGKARLATWRDVEALVAEIERLQADKVLELGRRLRPGLTAEDSRNPHDFPELADPDWQYADGTLAGIQTVLAAVRARLRTAEEERR